MTLEKYLTYRGDLRAVAAAGGQLAFVTEHPEGLPTAVYRLDPTALTLAQDALPAGGKALLAAGDDLWVAGTDRQLYRLPTGGGTPEARGPQLPDVPAALAPLAGDRLAVATGSRVVIVSRGDGRPLQTLDLPGDVTCLAADPTGKWLAAGTSGGAVAVYESETNPAEFRPSDTATLHEAAVTALLFEADELRFLSAGADQKLLSTHARGRLEAEDRGRGANHDEPVTALVAGPADRFLSGSTDSSLKSWPRAKGARPVTQKDGVGKVVGLAVVPVHGKPQVVAACQDNTLRFFALDEEGKFGEPGARVHGADAWAKAELQKPDPRRREEALRALAGFGDAAAVKRLAAQMDADADHGLRLLAGRLLGEAAHPRAAKALEKALGHKDEAVRVAAFDALVRRAGPDDQRPLLLALKAGKADVGRRAVEALAGRAGRDEQARAGLVGALAADTPEVRRAALTGLEGVYAADVPDASLAALTTPHADLRRLALVRLYQRKLLNDARVQAGLRWRGEDPDPEVRRVAFLLSLHTRERLLRALRQRDPELDRQLTELESGALPTIESPAPAAATAASARNDLAEQVEQLARSGLLPAELITALQQLLAQDPGNLEQVLAQITAQIDQLSRGEEAPEEDEP